MKKTGIALAIAAAPLIMVLVCVGTAVVMVMATIAGAVASLTGASSVLLQETSGGDCAIWGLPSESGGTTQAGTTYADLNEAQRRNSTVIIGVAKGLDIPEQGWVIALMTAMQETGLLNLASRANPDSLNYPHDGVAAGNYDSVGLFQQRDGWGPMADRMDPVHSATMFFTGGKAGQRGLLDINGWQAMMPGEAAQAVQVSAYADRYAQWEAMARDIVANLGGAAGPISGDGGLLCGNGLGLTCPATSFSAESGLTPDALRVIRCIHQNFPTITTFYGVGEREGVSDHPSGRAVDAMIPQWQNDDGKTLGWSVANWVRANAAGLGVTYVIWDAKIWSVRRNAEGWRAYTAGGSDPTSQHLDHVHVSVEGNAAAGGGEGWAAPLRPGYHVTTRFGEYDNAHTDHAHTGIDLAISSGTPIFAAAEGVVIFAGWGGGYGNLVEIRHLDGTVTYYGHQSNYIVAKGTHVTSGQQIGNVGSTGNSTGPHLHFEVRPNGGAPINPEPFMAQRGVKL
ncbi:M23 family metallopeptidase [Dactylosporangium cerinum]|uniref:M23 family metallopeptidase n=1 Tax=Dactylosporangium cerinum TaxID=1434730 RepID=A0ABV9WJ90_9ACTN